MIRKKTIPDSFTFFEHWDELRIRLIWSLIAVGAGAVIAYGFSDRLMAAVIRPIGVVVFTSPPDAFIARINLAFAAGLILALPVVILQAWRFVTGALKPHERRAVAFFAPVSIVLFLLGVSFGYCLVVPVTVRLLMGFATPELIPMITISNYIAYVGSTSIAFGVVFELPLLLLFLARIGIATPEFLVQKRRYAVMIILIVSAVITPPDGLTLFLMSVPLCCLYEIGILAVKTVHRKEYPS
jgi:sec-independent protein translocase protein TatC